MAIDEKSIRAESIKWHYVKLGVTQIPGDLWVEDTRKGSFIGPFKTEDAHKMSSELNTYVMENGVRKPPFKVINPDGEVVEQQG